MLELYLIFFGVGALLFGGIVYYSLAQKRRQESLSHDEYVDPLFAELEEQKARKLEEAKDAVMAPLDKSGSDTDEPTSDVANIDSSGANKSGVEAVRTDDKPTDNIVDGPSTESPDGTPREARGSIEKPDKAEPSLQKPSSPNQPSPDKAIERATGVKQEPSLSERPVSKSAKNSTASSASGQAPEAAVAKPSVDKVSATVLTELVARIKNPQPIEQQGLLSLFRKHDFKFHRKVHIYGLNQLTDMWRDIEFELPSARFTELGVSIQLADREGAMSKKELHDFQQMVLEFTNVYDAPFEFSMDLDESLKQASSLDQIGRRYDSMAVLNVVPKSKAGFRMADIESCARDLMMSTDKNGIFMKTRGHKSNMSVLFRLACTDGSGQFGVSSSAAPVHDLVVYMNVPATEDPEKVFQEMVKDANSLATWLEGKVVDRAGRVMTQRSYSMLMQQVSDIAFSMQQDGLIPGDAISKKLF